MSGRRGSAEVVGEAVAYPGVGVVGDLDGDAVQAGRDGRSVGRGGLEAEQIVVVDVVGEAVDAGLEALLGVEVRVFAAGHVGEGVGDVAAEGVDEQEDGLLGVGRGAAEREHFEQIVPAGMERDGVDDGVRAGEVGGDDGGVGLGAVIAGLADEQDGAAGGRGGGVGSGEFVEELVGVVDGHRGCGRPFRRRRAGGW